MATIEEDYVSFESCKFPKDLGFKQNYYWHPTIKSFTDLQQSIKLAEILPLESADMKWYFWKDEIDAPKLPTFGYSKDAAESYKDTEAVYLPCWSLAALLEQLDDSIADDGGNDWQLEINKEGGQYYLNYYDRWGNEEDIETGYYYDLVDACVEMILELHKLNLL